MSGTHIRFEVHDAEVRRMLVQQAIPDSGGRALAPRLGEYLQESTQRRFTTQQAPNGNAWQPLNPRYARRKKYNKDKILTLRGYLRRSIHYQVEGPGTVEVGTNVEYAAVQQFGGVIQQAPQSRKVRYRSVAGRVLFAGKKHKRATERWVTRGSYQTRIPARPFLGISDDDDSHIQAIIADWVAERGAG